VSASWPRAWRLILAWLPHDDDTRQLISDEIGDCPGCWRNVAEDLAGITATDMVCSMGWDRAVAHTEEVIAISLDAVARDEGEWAP